MALSGEAAAAELVPGRATAGATALAITAVLWDDAFAASPAAVRAGLHQAAGTAPGERHQLYGGLRRRGNAWRILQYAP